MVKAFEQLGRPVYIMDEKIKELIKTDEQLRSRIKILLGDESFNEDGTYNTKYVGSIIFNDMEKREILASTIGESLMPDMRSFYGEVSKAPYVVVESTYFHEYKMTNLVDIMVGVHASEMIRHVRVQLRDKNLSYNEIVKRFASQMDQDSKMDLCDVVINNNSDNGIDMNEINKWDKLFRKISTIKQ